MNNKELRQVLDYVERTADDEAELAKRYVRSDRIYPIHAHAAEKLKDVAKVIHAALGADHGR